MAVSKLSKNGIEYYINSEHCTNHYELGQNKDICGKARNAQGLIITFLYHRSLFYSIATRYRAVPLAQVKAELRDLIELQLPAVAREIKTAAHYTTPHAAFYGVMIPSLEVEQSLVELKRCLFKAFFPFEPHP